MAKNTKSKNGVKNDNYSSAYEMDRTGNTYEEENKSKNGYKQDGNTRDCHKNKAEDTWETDRKYYGIKEPRRDCVMLAPGFLPCLSVATSLTTSSNTHFPVAWHLRQAMQPRTSLCPT